MYKLYTDLNDGSNHVFYQNTTTPHLWLLATNGARTIDRDSFFDNLIEIASRIGDDLFTDEVANMISSMQLIDFKMLAISGPSCEYTKEELIALVESFDYEKIIGNVVNRIEYYATAESEEYFKQHRKSYRAQYRSITKILVYINVAVFIFNLVFGTAMIQYIWPGMSLLNPMAYLMILLGGFTHLSFFHIFFNMSFLLSVGEPLERLLGKGRFLALYFFSLVVSGVIVILFSHAPTAGASGALYGLFTFFICLTLKHETNQQQIRNVLSTFGINILFTLLAPGISLAGHLGGAVAGVIAFLIYNRK